MGLVKGKAVLASPVVLPADSSSQCECVLPALLARAMWGVLTAWGHVCLLSSAPAAPPACRTFRRVLTAS